MASGVELPAMRNFSVGRVCWPATMGRSTAGSVIVPSGGTGLISMEAGRATICGVASSPAKVQVASPVFFRVSGSGVSWARPRLRDAARGHGGSALMRRADHRPPWRRGGRWKGWRNRSGKHSCHRPGCPESVRWQGSNCCMVFGAVALWRRATRHCALAVEF